jgi:nickel-dependent lactate racemase
MGKRKFPAKVDEVDKETEKNIEKPIRRSYNTDYQSGCDRINVILNEYSNTNKYKILTQLLYEAFKHMRS